VCSTFCAELSPTRFGKPYSLAYGSYAVIGILSLFAMLAPGLYEWAEKLFWLVMALAAFIEYFYNGVSIGEKLKNEENSDIYSL